MVTSTDTITDEELVARCKRELPGNTRSYELLVHRHMNRVYSIVYRIVCNKEEAEDITQEVFLDLFSGQRFNIYLAQNYSGEQIRQEIKALITSTRK